jgi:hypothetical protein
MMKKTLLTLLLCCFVFILSACGGQAQPTAGPGSYVSSDGKFTFSYPPEWSLVMIGAENILDVSRFADTPDTVQIEVSVPMTFAAYTEAGLGSSVRDIVNAKAQLWQRFGPRVSPDVVIQTADITEFTVEGRPAAFARPSVPLTSGGNFGIMIVAVQVSDEHVVTITALPPQGEEATALDASVNQVLAIANSVRYSP